MKLSRPTIFSILIATIILILCASRESHAVPSYSRQTGMACSVCHYAPSELTPFGRKFKLDGYVFRTKPEVTEDKKDHNSAWHILESFPLSVVLDTTFTSTGSPQPGTQNGNFQFPQDVSLFLAGAWGSHVGSFAQVTYTPQDDHFTWDNTDVRYANSHDLFGKPFTYGLMFNNNPTVEDLWNSTPAWGFPFIGSNVAPTPMTGAIINGGLAQDVAGFGGCGMWNEHFYIAGTIYRSQHIGGPQPNPGSGFGTNIRGMAPYWRVAYTTATKNNNLEIGAYGIHVKTSPGAITGPTDSYTDWAGDFQYDRTIPQFKNDVLSFRGTYIRENSSLDATFGVEAASVLRHHLNTFQGTAEYHYGTKLSGTVGYFTVSGTPDPLLFPQAEVSGSANGDPRSNGYLLNLSWWPEQNIDLSVQYTGYLRFNGAQLNYDGAGRKAGANNTVLLVARFVF